MVSDTQIRAALPPKMAEYVIKQRDRIDALGRDFGPIGAQASWLTIVECLIAKQVKEGYH